MTTWNGDPSVIAFVAAVTLLYAVGLARDARPSTSTAGEGAIFASLGILALVAALISPLDALADRVLFSAHMAQHLLLLLVTPTFLVVGAPNAVVELERSLARTQVGRLALSMPALLLVSIGTLWAWHAPGLFDAALHDNLIHILEHATFLGTSLLFWWPALRPEDFPGNPPDFARLVYLFGAAVASSLLAAFIAFSADPLYAVSGLSPVAFGLSPLEDQQLGGILMWGFGGLWYFGAAGVVFIHWFTRARVIEDAEPLPIFPLPGDGA